MYPLLQTSAIQIKGNNPIYSHIYRFIQSNHKDRYTVECTYWNVWDSSWLVASGRAKILTVSGHHLVSLCIFDYRPNGFGNLYDLTKEPHCASLDTQYLFTDYLFSTCVHLYTARSNFKLHHFVTQDYHLDDVLIYWAHLKGTDEDSSITHDAAAEFTTINHGQQLPLIAPPIYALFFFFASREKLQ